MSGQTNTELAQVVLALGGACCVAGGNESREQERDENADDGNHDQQFDESKTLSLHVMKSFKKKPWLRELAPSHDEAAFSLRTGRIIEADNEAKKNAVRMSG
jgi:hypothetical protein